MSAGARSTVGLVQPATVGTRNGHSASAPLRWPGRHDLFGVRVSATEYEELIEAVVRAVRSRAPACIDHMPVHGLIEASRDESLRETLNAFEVVAPDGQPVRWALNAVHRTGLRERVYGPEFMLRLCERAAREGIGIYLLGGRPEVLEQLERNLRFRIPDLRVAGRHSPPFRALDQAEIAALAERIETSGAGVVFLGLGCPKQERYAWLLREAGVRAVQVCVGAAFDFHGGSKPMAPPWMQKRGLEWLFRLGVEPGRLWRRYLVTNTLFLWKFGRLLIRRGGGRG